jgi:hypothetical protein
MREAALAALFVGIGITIALALAPHRFEWAPLWAVNLFWAAGLSLTVGAAVHLTAMAWLRARAKLPGGTLLRWRCLSFAEATRIVLQTGERGELFGTAYPAGGQPEEKLRWCMLFLIASGIEFSGRRSPSAEVRVIAPVELAQMRPRLGSNDLMGETGRQAAYRDVGVPAIALRRLLSELRSAHCSRTAHHPSAAQSGA